MRSALLVGRLSVVVCVLLGCAASASAQSLGGARPQATAPRQQGGLTAFRTVFDLRHLDGANADSDFNWDLDLSLDFDFVDLGIVRGNVHGVFETIIGNEFRDVDPNQTNYVADLSVFIRLPRGELATTFHHVSRHQIDRPDAGSVSWNMVGVSYGDQLTVGRFTIDAGVRAMGTVERAGVDYRGQLEGFLRLVRPVSPILSIIAGADGVIAPVATDVFQRDMQRGGRLEGGVRLRSPVGVTELFAAWEQRIDASPVRRQTTRWAQFGFRLMTPAP